MGDQIPLLFTTIWGDQPNGDRSLFSLRQGFVPGRYHFVHLARDVTKKPHNPDTQRGNDGNLHNWAGNKKRVNVGKCIVFGVNLGKYTLHSASELLFKKKYQNFP